jgi:hypothetical protein
MQDKPNAVSADQLRCLRNRMSGKAYRDTKRDEVAKYAERHPTKIDEQIVLLDEGAAKYMGQLVMAGAHSNSDGKDVDIKAILMQAKAEELLAFMTLMTSAEHQELRDMSGLTMILDTGKASSENKPIDESPFATMASKLLLQAMSACEVPTSVMFE